MVVAATDAKEELARCFLAMFSNNEVVNKATALKVVKDSSEEFKSLGVACHLKVSMATIKRIAEKVGTIKEKLLSDDEVESDDGNRCEEKFRANLMDSIRQNDVHMLP